MFNVKKFIFIALVLINSVSHSFSSDERNEIKKNPFISVRLDKYTQDSYKKIKHEINIVKSNLKAIYTPFINLISSYIDFSYEELIKLNNDYNRENELFNKYLNNLKNFYYENEDVAYGYLNDLKSLNSSQTTTEEVLNLYLEQRIEYLRERDKKKNYNNSCLIAQLDTYPDKIKEYENNYLSGKEPCPNHIIAIGNINRYQIHSLMIYNAVKISDKTKFFRNDIRILSCLKTLHPFFNSESTELSHPDAGKADLRRYESGKKQPLPQFLQLNFSSLPQTLKAEVPSTKADTSSTLTQGKGKNRRRKEKKKNKEENVAIQQTSPSQENLTTSDLKNSEIETIQNPVQETVLTESLLPLEINSSEIPSAESLSEPKTAQILYVENVETIA